jgi:hypothetical protein
MDIIVKATDELIHKKKLKLRRNEKAKDFDNYIYNLKIWNKCKQFLEDDDEENDTDECEYFSSLLFDSYYDKPGKYTSRLACLVDQLKKWKKRILKNNDYTYIEYDISTYENIKKLITAWIMYSDIATKQMLITQQPLCVDVHNLILGFKLY